MNAPQESFAPEFDGEAVTDPMLDQLDPGLEDHIDMFGDWTVNVEPDPFEQHRALFGDYTADPEAEVTEEFELPEGADRLAS
jgi:hypothetical protein